MDEAADEPVGEWIPDPDRPGVFTMVLPPPVDEECRIYAEYFGNPGAVDMMVRVPAQWVPYEVEGIAWWKTMLDYDGRIKSFVQFESLGGWEEYPALCLAVMCSTMSAVAPEPPEDNWPDPPDYEWSE